MCLREKGVVDFLLSHLFFNLSEYINFVNIIIMGFRTNNTECGVLRGVVSNVLNCHIVISKFELQSQKYIHFQTNTLGKCIISPESGYIAPLLFLTMMSVHWTTHEGWYAIKQRNRTADGIHCRGERYASSNIPPKRLWGYNSRTFKRVNFSSSIDRGLLWPRVYYEWINIWYNEYYPLSVERRIRRLHPLQLSVLLNYRGCNRRIQKSYPEYDAKLQLVVRPTILKPEGVFIAITLTST